MPHLLSLAAAEDRILTLEDNMVRLRAELFTTKKTRNSFAPLCALPIEILRRILLNTQSSTSAQDVKASRLGLHHFSFNDGWEEVVLTCARIHEVSMSTPELWEHVDLSWTPSRISAYMARAGTINMVLECTQRPWRQKENLARDCFRRSCAANILTAMPELERESPRRLLILHLNRQSTEDF
jgi:hypothetical protein